MDDIGSAIDAEMQSSGVVAPAVPVQDQNLTTRTVQAGTDPIDAAIDREMNAATYGTIGQQVLTGLEGFAKGVAGPFATGAEKIASEAGIPGLTPQDQAAREEAHPWTHGISEATGLVSGALTGTGEGALLEAAGKLIPEGVGVASKIGSSVLRGIAENSLYQAGDEVSRYINNPTSIESAIPRLFLSGAIGGGFGGGVGVISSLWRATGGQKVAAILRATADRAGGIEGEAIDPVQEMISKTGMKVDPAVAAVASGNPEARDLAANIANADTRSNKSFQADVASAKTEATEAMVGSLNHEGGGIPGRFDEHGFGTSVGKTLEEETAARVDPVSRQFDEFGEKFKGKDLSPSIAEKVESGIVEDAKSNLDKATRVLAKAQKAVDVEGAVNASQAIEIAQNNLMKAEESMKIPGDVDDIANKLSDLSTKEGWASDPKSKPMRTISDLLEQLPKLKTLSSLDQAITLVNDRLPYNALDPQQNRINQLITKVIRTKKADLIGEHIGSEEGVSVLEKYNAARTAYATESQIKDSIPLNKLGSTSSYPKRIAQTTKDNAEKIWRSLNGKNDAAWLDVVRQNFPKTAEAIRQGHLNDILSRSKGADGGVDPYKLITNLNKLSPQLRKFVVPGESAQTIGLLSDFLTKLKDPKFNYSASSSLGKTILKGVAGQGLGMLGSLMGHNPIMSYVLGRLGAEMGSEGPAAIRHGLLRWMGSQKAIEPGAFRSMVNVISTIQKGDNLVTRATRAIFKAGQEVIPSTLQPTPDQIDHLDKKLKTAQTDPTVLENTATLPGYYMPNHGMAMTATTTNAVGYLNSLRPAVVKNAPLDEEIEPSDTAISNFRRALEIGEQPLMVLHSIKEGQGTPDDVGHLKAIYPALYDRLCSKITEELTNHLAAGNTVPYPLKQGLSMFLGQPMDSSFSPASIASNQQVFTQVNQEQAAKDQMARNPRPSQTGMRQMKVASRLSLSNQTEES